MDSVRPGTRAAIQRLLAKGRSLDTPDCSVATIELASYWPDCIKTLGERFSYASPWHYQNVDICKPFELKEACKDGQCVSAQVERNARLLADRQVPERERLMAMAFLVHLVGDLHQPMHAGDHKDLGGNRVSANYGVVGGRANLHGIWDGWLAERSISTPPAGPSALLAQVARQDRERIAAGTVEDWSREMWAKSRDVAYKTMVPDPCGEAPAERPVLDEQEVRSLIPLVRENVVAGGLRLARLIDDALGPETKAPGQKR